MSNTELSADVVIIGGGHNGLVASAYLARAGRSVIVAEKQSVVGGAAVSEEFHPGFCNSVASYTVSLLNPKVIADLRLAHHGLQIIERPAANFWPVDETRGLLLPFDREGRQQAIAAFSPHDSEQLIRFEDALERAADILRTLVLQTPPNAGGGWLSLFQGARLARTVIGLSVDDQRLITDLFTLSVSDFLAQWFESPIIKGAFAFDGIVGAYASPSMPGTAYVLLHHCFGEVNGKAGMWGHAIGGMGAISEAIARAARAAGAQILTDAGVETVIVENGRAAGLALQDGRRIKATCVASGVAPKLLFRDLLPSEAVPRDIADRFLAIKSGSGTFRMNVALDGLPDFTCRPGTQPDQHHGAGIIIGPTLDYLEAAYHDARTLGWSRAPVVEMVIPSTLDSSLAPDGKHVASLFVQHVAPTLPEPRTWQDEGEKEKFAEVVIDTVTQHAPNFRDLIVGRQVLSPLDLERRFGLIDGDIFHGQLSLNQLFSLRPVLGYADYRLPVKGLYLCGSGAHPGGGVSGVPGHNAAREILRDLNTPWRWN